MVLRDVVQGTVGLDEFKGLSQPDNSVILQMSEQCLSTQRLATQKPRRRFCTFSCHEVSRGETESCGPRGRTGHGRMLWVLLVGFKRWKKGYCSRGRTRICGGRTVCS